MHKLSDIDASKLGSIEQHATSLCIVIARYSDDSILHDLASSLLFCELAAVSENLGGQFLTQVCSLSVFIVFQLLFVDGEGLDSEETTLVLHEVV
mmetsp:Transcript_8638/g.10132  ORF Transcript_8638/g.10132 Transcript_8638/m.10132 type:complete len:95 (+) Transcript_8638:388-672(+)